MSSAPSSAREPRPPCSHSVRRTAVSELRPTPRPSSVTRISAPSVSVAVSSAPSSTSSSVMSTPGGGSGVPSADVAVCRTRRRRTPSEAFTMSAGIFGRSGASSWMSMCTGWSSLLITTVTPPPALCTASTFTSNVHSPRSTRTAAFGGTVWIGSHAVDGRARTSGNASAGLSIGVGAGEKVAVKPNTSKSCRDGMATLSSWPGKTRSAVSKDAAHDPSPHKNTSTAAARIVVGVAPCVCV
mmetsp:Transcript_25541/g.66003  ORF Transcript_25541/g.66003 Transcript_25541/m.66003 type:complete len:241 (+) Transcript_25541:1150-1872(+)